MFILQSRFKVPVSMVLLYEIRPCNTIGMRQSALLTGQATGWGDGRRWRRNRDRGNKCTLINIVLACEGVAEALPGLQYRYQ
jgi:hypothetical protein